MKKYNHACLKHGYYIYDEYECPVCKLVFEAFTINGQMDNENATSIYNCKSQSGRDVRKQVSSVTQCIAEEKVRNVSASPALKKVK